LMIDSSKSLRKWRQAIIKDDTCVCIKDGGGGSVRGGVKHDKGGAV
jgi:hypothetical protein